jgi:hypothetical protein
MKISDTEIKKFQTIFKKKYGCEIKEEEAMISARALLNFINAGLSFNKTKDADK